MFQVNDIFFPCPHCQGLCSVLLHNVGILTLGHVRVESGVLFRFTVTTVKWSCYCRDLKGLCHEMLSFYWTCLVSALLEFLSLCICIIYNIITSKISQENLNSAL